MIRIGCVQTNPIFGDIESNLKSFEQFVSEADADLIVFPELAFTGYFFTSTTEAKKYAEPIGGTLLGKIKQIAKSHNIAIVTGFLEEDNGILYNSAVAIGCNGELVGHYRKVHLFYYETQVFAKGNLSFPVCDIQVRNGEIIKLGLEICYDWRFPEATRSLAIKGADVIAIPSNIVTTTVMLIDVLKVRAFENKVIIAFADRIGKESGKVGNNMEELVFRGQSCIINYNGEVLAMDTSQGESITYADVMTENTRSKSINKFNNIIDDRQAELYFT
jgi:predicted amidohydrolase